MPIPVIIQSAYARIGVPDTSSSPNTIGTGLKAFTTTGSVSYAMGQQVRLMSAAGGAGVYMDGLVTDYTAPALTVDVTTTGGSGSHSDWNIGVENVTLTLPSSPTPNNLLLLIGQGSYWNDPRRGLLYAPAGFGNIFWSGYWNSPTQSNFNHKYVSPGDPAAYAVGVKNDYPPLVGTIHLLLLEIYGVRASTLHISTFGYYGNLTGSGSSSNNSDIMIVSALAGDGATLGISGTGYSVQEYFHDSTPTSFLNAASVAHVGNGGSPYTVTWGDAPTHGSQNTTTGYEGVTVQYIAMYDPAVSIVSSLNPSVTGDSVTFTANVTGSGGTATGNVTFVDSVSGTLATVALVAGSAACTTSALTVASHVITANYGGDSNYVTGSSSLVQVVNFKPPTTTTILSSQNPLIVGHSVTFSITVAGTPGGPPTGTVALTDSLPGFPDPVLSLASGTASWPTSSLSVGDHTITATYSGDSNFSSSLGTVLQVVDPKGTTVTSVSSSEAPSCFGDVIVLNVQVTSQAGTPTGSVDLTDSIVGYLGNFPLSGGIATYSAGGSWSAASHLVTATYGETSDYYGSSGSLVQLVLMPRGSLLDLPGFALIASYRTYGDSNLPSWASFSALPSSVAVGQPVFILWTSNNVVEISIVGTNGIDSVSESISTVGSGIYEVAGGFQTSITLACTGYDSGGNAIGSQDLSVTVT